MAPRVSFAGVHPLHHCKLWYFLAFGAYACVSPYLPLHYRRWGLTPDEVGFINCLRPLVSFAITPAWGFLADHTGRHNAILVAKMLLQGYGTLALFAVPARVRASVFAFVVALEIFSCANNTLADSATQLMCERARSLGETPSLGASYGDQRLWGAWRGGSSSRPPPPRASSVVAYAPAPVADAAPFYAHAALLTIGAGVSLGLDFEHRGQSAGGGGGGRKSRRRRRVERAREAFEEEADEADVADEADADREGESAALLLSDDDDEEEEDRDGGRGRGSGERVMKERRRRGRSAPPPGARRSSAWR